MKAGRSPAKGGKGQFFFQCKKLELGQGYQGEEQAVERPIFLDAKEIGKVKSIELLKVYGEQGNKVSQFFSPWWDKYKSNIYV